MDEKRIFLARHGQTFHNAAAGESYVDADRLSETGWEQARRLGRLLAGRDVATVVTSPLARARETAEAVNETLGCPLEEDERLIEIVPPVHEDDEPEREVEHWSVYMARIADDRHYAIGGAESFAAVMESSGAHAPHPPQSSTSSTARDGAPPTRTSSQPLIATRRRRRHQ